MKILKMKSFHYKPDLEYLLSMANADPNTNDSQLFVSTVSTPNLVRKHVVFRQVIKGLGVARMLENVDMKNLPNPYC